MSKNTVSIPITEYARVIYPKGKISLHPLMNEDIPAVAELYREVWITAQNFRERLSMDNDRSFKNIGGMFIIQDAESLKKMLHNPLHIATVAKNQQGQVIAFIGIGFISPDRAAHDKITYFDWCRHFDDEIRQADRSGALAWGGEMISAANHLYPSFSVPLIHTQFRLMQNRGIRLTLGEIYRVTGYSRDGAAIETDLLNERSMAAFKRIGAVHIGESPTKRLSLDSLQVTIHPQVICCDINEALKATCRVMHDKNLTYQKGVI